MSTYCIGDIQGCYEPLMRLLALIKFDPAKDQIWLVGDLVNRGPDSLKVLRWAKNLVNAKIVLGNHDLHLLTFYHKITDFEFYGLEEVVNAPDAQEIIDWVRSLPLFYYDPKLKFTLTHAGIFPLWNLKEAESYAKEVETVLKSPDYISFLKNMYGNEPDTWHQNLTGYQRLRFIVNAFTRMRFCDLSGKLDFKHIKLEKTPSTLVPWFSFPERKTKKEKIIFGHWAALEGKVEEPNIYALDTGCVWGKNLTALRLEDQVKFSVPCNCKT
jgi:bis(5'-nucleosyl)-tetraphosphatase (symmetrical)